MAKTYYCFEDKTTGEQYGFDNKRNFAKQLSEGAEQLDGAVDSVAFVFVNAKGERHEVDPYALVEWYRTTQAERDAKFLATHRQVFIKAGVTPFAKPRVIWVKN